MLNTPMTRERFEQQVTHILTAFDLPIENPLPIQQATTTTATTMTNDQPLKQRSVSSLEFESRGDSFHLTIHCLTRDELLHSFDIYLHSPFDSAANATEQWLYVCPEEPDGSTTIYRKNCPPQYEHLMQRALARLGYDVPTLYEKANIPLTTHEKLELQLRQREAQQSP